MENNVKLEEKIELKDTDKKYDRKLQAENMRLRKEIKRLETELNQLKQFLGVY